MSAYQNCLDVLLIQSFELVCNKSARWVSRKDSIVEISPDKEKVGLVFESKVDECLEALLEVSFAFEAFGSVLDCGGVEVVVSGED